MSDVTDREFWLLIRRALLMICKAIEAKYQLEKSIEKNIS